MSDDEKTTPAKLRPSMSLTLHRGHPEDFGMKGMGDYDLWMKIETEEDARAISSIMFDDPRKVLEAMCLAAVGDYGALQDYLSESGVDFRKIAEESELL